MRPIVGGGSFWSTHFKINGTEIVTLTNNGYSWVTLDDAGIEKMKYTPSSNVSAIPRT